jgi:polyisoprenoid-binding protein YceI
MKPYTNISKTFLLIAIFTLGSGSAIAEVETYAIDNAHSGVNFKIRHFFTRVPGNFAEFKGTITVDRDNMENSSTEAVIAIASVDTNNEKRDKHLQGEDFFLVSDFAYMSFKSSKWETTGENTYAVTAQLTIKDITKEVVLNVTSLGFGKGNRDSFISGWEGETTIDRTDFGINYGQGVVGNEVEINIFIEAKRL